jgi:hypothetical protein
MISAMIVVCAVPMMSGSTAGLVWPLPSGSWVAKKSPRGTSLKKSIAGCRIAAMMPSVITIDRTAASCSSVLMIASPGRDRAERSGAGPAPEGEPGSMVTVI